MSMDVCAKMMVLLLHHFFSNYYFFSSFISCILRFCIAAKGYGATHRVFTAVIFSMFFFSIFRCHSLLFVFTQQFHAVFDMELAVVLQLVITVSVVVGNDSLLNDGRYTTQYLHTQYTYFIHR